MWIICSIYNNSVKHNYTVCQKHIYFKLFKQLYVTIQLIVNTVLMSKKQFHNQIVKKKKKKKKKNSI